MTRRTDVVIVGGGPAGSAAAIELARSQISATLVDETPREGAKVGEALPPAVNPLLRHLDVWEPMLASRHRPSPGNESLWGHASPTSVDFIRDPGGPGWHVDRKCFDAMLRTSAAAHGATLLEGVTVRGLARAAGVWRLTVANRDSISDLEADWVLDCSGRRGAIARRLGVRRIRYDALVAAVVFLRRDGTVPDIDGLTYVEAAPNGWWYTAALASDRRVTAYFTDRHDPTASQARSPEGYAQMIAATRLVRERVAGSGYVAEASPRFIGAETSRLEFFADAGWTVAGDAAMTFDPLSSHGIFFALRSGVNAARAVQGALLGDAGALDTYSRGLENAFSKYLEQRHAYYRAEQRWAERPFWHTRHLPSTSQPSTSAR